MNSMVKRVVAASLALGVVGLGMSACADNESSIFIRQVLMPSESDCSYSGDPGEPALLVGTLDLAFRTEYLAGLLIGNQLVERGDPDLLRTESARFRAEGAEVRVERPDGELLEEFTTPVSGFADPSSGTAPGWGVVGAVLIDSGTGRALGTEYASGARSDKVGRVVVAVKVFGRTLGGQELESGELRFPVDICYGCLISFPPGVNCESAEEADTGGTVPCLVGQDAAIDCRVCYAMMRSNVCL